MEARTIEWCEEVVNRSLKSIEGWTNEGDWNEGFAVAFRWTRDRLEELKQSYVLKAMMPKEEPAKPIPFKVGQTLRRTSDGLKCMIVQTESDYVYMVQLNNGKQFAGKIHLPGLDITPQALQQISGGYSFVTETKGRELGLAWAKEEERRIPGQMTKPMNNREFGGGTYSQH